MVLVVMQLHDLLVDRCFQGVISVRKRRQFKGHKRFLPAVCGQRLLVWMLRAYPTTRADRPAARKSYLRTSPSVHYRAPNSALRPVHSRVQSARRTPPKTREVSYETCPHPARDGVAV